MAVPSSNPNFFPDPTPFIMICPIIIKKDKMLKESLRNYYSWPESVMINNIIWLNIILYDVVPQKYVENNVCITIINFYKFDKFVYNRK